MNWIFLGALGGALAVIAGAFGAHALAARLDVEVDRNSSTHAISFRRGAPGIFTEQGLTNTKK